MTGSEVNHAPLHDAAARNRTAEQAPHVRAQGCASSARLPFGEHQGQLSRHDVGETVMPGAMVLVTFAETKSPARKDCVRNQDTDVLICPSNVLW
jgi:hypothetical protein